MHIWLFFIYLVQVKSTRRIVSDEETQKQQEDEKEEEEEGEVYETKLLHLFSEEDEVILNIICILNSKMGNPIWRNGLKKLNPLLNVWYYAVFWTQSNRID